MIRQRVSKLYNKRPTDRNLIKRKQIVVDLCEDVVWLENSSIIFFSYIII